MPKKVDNQNSESFFCERLLRLANSANFIKLTFVVFSHKNFWWGCFATPRLLRTGNSSLLPLHCYVTVFHCLNTPLSPTALFSQRPMSRRSIYWSRFTQYGVRIDRPNIQVEHTQCVMCYIMHFCMLYRECKYISLKLEKMTHNARHRVTLGWNCVWDRQQNSSNSSPAISENSIDIIENSLPQETEPPQDVSEHVIVRSLVLDKYFLRHCIIYSTTPAQKHKPAR